MILSLFNAKAQMVNGAELKVGSVLTVPHSMWVKLEKRISNAGRTFSRGDNARLGVDFSSNWDSQDGTFWGTQTVKILRFSKDKQRALVKFYTPETVRGTSCPSGAVFFLDVKDLSTFTKRFQERKLALDNNAEELLQKNWSVQGALSCFDQQAGKAAPGQDDLNVGSVIPVSGHKWVNVEKTISNNNVTFHPGKNAVIGPSYDKEEAKTYAGKVGILSFSQDNKRALVMYIDSQSRGGTECPSGAVFFLNKQDLLDFKVAAQGKKKNLLKAVLRRP